jgi:hypothetical protein
MRLTSEFWVSQLMRRVFKDGGYAAVIKKGAAEAGAIFIKVQFRDRAFSLVLERVNASEIEEKLAREGRFDPDFWAVELEPLSEDVTKLF